MVVRLLAASDFFHTSLPLEVEHSLVSLSAFFLASVSSRPSAVFPLRNVQPGGYFLIRLKLEESAVFSFEELSFSTAEMQLNFNTQVALI